MRLIFGGNSDIGKAIKGKHLPSSMDVTNPHDIRNYMKITNPTEVVNCAGVIKAGVDMGYYQEINVNLIGSFNIARSLTKEMKAVFISSTSGLHGRAGWSGYCASKAGVISLVQSLTEEGYQVWCISPGRVKTKMRKRLFPDEDQKTLLKPKEVAKVVEDCFKGKYKTGSNIIVRKNEEIEIQD
jgi:NAD(P)-dependent dehydrogenase (short-subunit alcohol dehydrogenase family)